MANGARAGSAPSDVLRWAFATTILLGVVVTVLSAVEVQRARREVDVLVRTADRSSLLVGEIGRHVTRLRAKALDRLLHPASEGRETEERVAVIVTTLDERLRELETVLQPQERARWTRFFPLVETFRARVDHAMDELQRGRTGEAEAILANEVTPLGLRVQDQLDVLTALNEEQSRALLGAADRRLARVRLLTVTLGVALTVCLGLIWWTALGALEAQRRRLAEYTARIEQSNRDLDAFAGRVAHDLRNALSPIGLIAGGLREARERPEMVARLAGQLRDTVRRGQKLIDGLLVFSRPQTAADRTAATPLAPVVDDVLDELAPLTARVGAAVRVEVPALALRCPASLLQIVLANLAGNALKYMDGCRERHMRIAASVAGDGWCEVVVDDSGPGIPASALPHVFDPFYRVPGTTAPGTGIGLATVRRIVTGCGGTIAVDSSPGRGTTFRIRLPGHTLEADAARDDVPAPGPARP